MSSKQELEFAQLVLSALEGDISGEQSRVLTNTLNRDPKALPLYVSLMKIYTELSPFGSVRIPPISEPQSDNQAENLNELLNILAAEENNAPIVNVPKPVEPKPISKPDEMPVPVRKVSTLNLWILGLSMAALLVIVTFLKIVPYFETVPVATLSDSIHAEYIDETFPAGSRLTNRKEPYRLQKGVARIAFDSGASVVIEAPAEFQINTRNTMVLHSGRLFAVVPEQATGFTVKTATSTVIDLGTEFGLHVAASQETELHVFSGKTKLYVSLFNQPQITTGQARSVDAVTGAIKTIPFEKYRFIRRIDSGANIISRGRDMISLADLVKGGNGYGTSWKTSEIYSVDTGQKIIDRNDGYRTLDNTYRKVAANPFIDGIFVPNGNHQTVSSDGHVFADCPETSGLFFSDLRFSNSWEYAPPAARLYQTQRNLNFAPAVVLMHSNIGVTFDLDAVRRQFPGRSIRRFLTSAGNLFVFEGIPVAGAEEYSPGSTEFDVWIVVDGQLRSKAPRVRWDSLIALEAPIRAGDRFLSILVTDGGIVYEGDNANHYDSCGLADMRLEIELIE